MPDGSRLDQKPGAGPLNPANIVTFMRLCSVPMAFWMVLEHRTGVAFWLFVAAGLSDALDGWLARRYGSNPIGAILDPVADKALLVTMFITLAAIRELPLWLTTLVVFRDLLIVGGVVVLTVIGHAVTIRPLYISKVNTVLQIALVALTLLQNGFDLPLPWVTPVLIWTVTATTLASGAIYVWNTARGDIGGACRPG